MTELSNEAMLAVLQERIAQAERRNDERHDALRIEQSEMQARLLNEIGGLKLYQREQNGNVSKILGRVSSLEGKKVEHDDWHGANDQHIAQRIGVLEQEAHDGKVRHAVLVAEWKVMMAGITFGAGAMAGITASLHWLGVL